LSSHGRGTRRYCDNFSAAITASAGSLIQRESSIRLLAAPHLARARAQAHLSYPATVGPKGDASNSLVSTERLTAYAQADQAHRGPDQTGRRSGRGAVGLRAARLRPAGEAERPEEPHLAVPQPAGPFPPPHPSAHTAF
jgi:hypothetical protein